MARGDGKNLGPWFRTYVSILDDPKLAKLTDTQYRAWHKLIALAKFHGGTVPDCIIDIAFRLRVPTGKARDLLQVLVSATLFDYDGNGYTPHNWKIRQFESDVSTDRVKRFRNARETADETFQKQPMTVSETAPDTDTDTDTEAEDNQSSAPPLAAPLPIEPDSKPASQPKTTKGRRWRVDEEIPPNWIFEAEKSRSEHELPAVNLILEATKFGNYWASKTGRGATHADWKRTWLNWALNAKGDANGRSRTPTKTEQWRDGIAAFIAAGEEPPGPPCDDHTRTPVAPNGTAGRGLSGERSGENDAAIPGVFRRLT